MSNTVQGRARWWRVIAVALAGVACAIVLVARAAGASAPAPAWIYYVSYPGGTRCVVSEIWRVRPDGSDPQAVLPPAIDDFSYETFTSDDTEGVFSVAPTGEYIVRVVKVDGPDIGGVPSEQTHLFLYDLVTGTVRQLTFGASFDQWPSISPDGQTVAFIRSSYHSEKGSDGNFHVGQGEPGLYTVPISGGTPRRVPTRLVAGGAELSWKSNGTIFYGTEVIDLQTGRQTPFVRPGPAYFFDVLSSTWTPMGLLYVGDYNLFDPSHGGTSAGRPPSGLYLASKPVRLKGRLLRRYRYPERSPVPNGLFSVHLMSGTTTVVAQYKNQVVTGPLTGGALKVLQVPRGIGTRPEVATGPETLAPTLAAAHVGIVPGCG